MYEPGSPADPSEVGGSKRRRLFPSRHPEPSAFEDSRLEAMVAAYHRVVVDRMDEGLRAIQQSAASLMHEIAGEVWKAGGADGSDIQPRILTLLSRDQAIRGLVAHSDERYQSLDTRVARIEEGLSSVVDSTRELRELVDRGVSGVREVMTSPAVQGLPDLHRRLSGVERSLGAAFQQITERDRALVNLLRRQTREHEAAIRQEAGRVVQALEGQVESGAVAAVDRLVETVQQQVHSVGSRVERHARALAGALAAHENRVLELLERPSARLDAALEGQLHAIRDTSREVADELSQSFNDRLIRLAHLVRSDTEWTHRRLLEITAQQDSDLEGVLDDRLGRVAEVIAAATRWAVEEISERATHETQRAVQVASADLQVFVDRQFARLNEDLDRKLGRLEDGMGRHAALAAVEAIEPRLERVSDRMDEALEGIGEVARNGLGRLLDARVGALARLIRSDNQILAGRLSAVEEQATAKQALRAVNELAASLPNEISHAFDRRFAVLADLLHRETQATVEAVARTGDAIGERVDRAASVTAERVGRELDSVIDRLSEAMESLAGGLGG